MITTLPRAKTLTLGTLVAGTALVLAACGGGGGTKASASPTSAPSASVTAYVNCLESHGYTPNAQFIQRLSSPPTTDANGGGGGGFFGGGGGADNRTPRSTIPAAQAQARRQALEACQSQAPAGFRFGGGNGGQFLSQLRTYASCLADHGYPDLQKALPPANSTSQPPTTGGAGFGAGLRQAMTAMQNSPAFQAANQTCKALAPAFRGPTSTTTPPTTTGA